MSDNKKKYDCTTCSYPRYKGGGIIFCDVCIRKILDEQRTKNRGRVIQMDADIKAEPRINKTPKHKAYER